jgi:hypothetical protein
MLLRDITEFIWAVLEQLHGWISGGILALTVEIAERVWNWKIRRKPWIAIFLVGGLVVSVFGAWREQRQKVRSQLAYMSIRVNESWIPQSAKYETKGRSWINFGKENATSYPATEESSIQELVIETAPYPLTSQLTNSNNPSSPELETSAWNEMLKNQGGSKHAETTFDPGERNWESAFTEYPLTQSQADRLEVYKTDMFYLVGLMKWSSGGSTHAKQFCYWIKPPGIEARSAPVAVTVDKCATHNDYVEDATPYLKHFQ